MWVIHHQTLGTTNTYDYKSRLTLAWVNSSTQIQRGQHSTISYRDKHQEPGNEDKGIILFIQ